MGCCYYDCIPSNDLCIPFDMKCEVTLYVAGNVFKEQVIARNYEEAKQTAVARNPTAKIVSVTAVFK